MSASEQLTQGRKRVQAGLVLGPLGPVARGREGEAATPELAAAVQALVAQCLCRGEGLDGVVEAADCLRLLWGVRLVHVWLPGESAWRSLPTHRGGEALVASQSLAEALSVAATSGQRLDWPAAPHQLDSAPGESLASACFQPLLQQGALQAVVSLHFSASRGFPTGDGALLAALGRQVAMALALHEAQVQQQKALDALMHEAQAHAAMRQAAEMAELSLKAKVARLKHDDQVKTDFLANLSHELRSPLTTIIGYGSMLEDGVAGALGGEQLLMVRRMLTAADAITWLVEDLLDLSRLRAGSFSLSPQPTHLAELLLEQGAAMAPLLDRAALRLHLDLGEPLPAIAIDPRRIAQALRNLLTNAIKHSPKGGSVTVQLKASALGQRIEVRDQGPGVPLAEHRSIFEPYRQLGAGGQGEGGLGLGLAITQRLVQAHGGVVGLCPESPGGACFFIDLPGQAG